MKTQSSHSLPCPRRKARLGTPFFGPCFRPCFGLLLALVLGGCTPTNTIVVTNVELRSGYVASLGSSALTDRLATRVTAAGGTCMPFVNAPAVMRCSGFGNEASTGATFGPYDDGVYRVSFRTWITKLTPDETGDIDSAELMSDAHRTLETWLIREGVPRNQIARATRRVGERKALDLLTR